MTASPPAFWKEQGHGQMFWSCVHHTLVVFVALGSRESVLCLPQAIPLGVYCCGRLPGSLSPGLPGISWSLLACWGGAIGGLLGAVPFLDSAGIIFRLADGGGGGCRWYY